VPEPPFTRYALYLTRTFGRRVYRVAVDGGFSCPNREGRSGGGCTFCAEQGSRAPYLGEAVTVREQVARAAAFLSSRYQARAFILYFQAFSATHAPSASLKAIYDEGLSAAPFVGLTVSTRPDCMDEEKAALLASYRERGLEVWVELGLQTAHEATLARIGRGHDLESFLTA
jgi:radical SAM protein (TIGR01212 family)